MKGLATLVAPITLFANFIFTLLFAHGLSVSDFGELIFAKNLYFVLLTIMTLGLDRSGLHIFKTKAAEAYPYTLAIKLHGYLLAVTILAVASTFTSELLSGTLILLVAILLAVSIFDARFIFDLNQRVTDEIFISLLKIAPYFLATPIILIFNNNLAPEHYFFIVLSGLVLCHLFQWVVLRPIPKVRISFQAMYQRIALSSFVWISSIIGILNSYVSSLVVAYYQGAPGVAYLGFFQNIYLGLLAITAVITRYFISENLNTSSLKYALPTYLKKMGCISLVFAVAGTVATWLLCRIFFPIYNAEFGVMIFLMLSFFVVSVGAVYGNGLVLLGKGRTLAESMFVVLLINFTLLLVLLPKLGLIGAGVATLVSSLAAVGITYYRFNVELSESLS